MVVFIGRVYLCVVGAVYDGGGVEDQPDAFFGRKKTKKL